MSYTLGMLIPGNLNPGSWNEFPVRVPRGVTNSNGECGGHWHQMN